ncbi:MAG: UrcA family protein [Pseudomonadota bacterium]
MRLTKILLVPVFAALATSQVASAGEVVEFTLKKSELSTPEQREVLLDRIERVSAESCHSSSDLVTRTAIKACTEDLASQFVKNIDDDSLTMLAQKRESTVYRSARAASVRAQ